MGNDKKFWQAISSLLFIAIALIVVLTACISQACPINYNSCVACHNGEQKAELGLKKIKKTVKKMQDCLKPGDQGCLDKATTFSADIGKGFRKFFKDTQKKMEGGK